MGRVTTIGEPLSKESQSRLCAEVYRSNSGASFGTAEMLDGLDKAAELLTPDVIAEEKSGAAYVASSRVA